MINGHEELPADLSTRKTTFSFKHQEALTDGQTLLTFVGALLGQWAVTYSTGYKMSDGSIASMQRMVGIMATRRESYRAGADRPTLECGVYDRYLMFQKSLCFAPCLFGYRVDLALSLLAEWCGLLPTDISVDSDFVGAYPWYLTDPGVGYLATPTNYGTPPYTPGKSDTGAQWMKTICERYPGLRCEFQPDGLLHIYVEPSSRARSLPH